MVGTQSHASTQDLLMMEVHDEEVLLGGGVVPTPEQRPHEEPPYCGDNMNEALWFTEHHKSERAKANGPTWWVCNPANHVRAGAGRTLEQQQQDLAKKPPGYLLLFAALEGCAECTRKLMEMGISVDFRSRCLGHNAMEWALHTQTQEGKQTTEVQGILSKAMHQAMVRKFLV